VAWPLLAAVLLSGCNQVICEHPWFTSEDAVDVPKLRDELWTIASDSDCRFDEGKPVDNVCTVKDVQALRKAAAPSKNFTD
jgi:hypothetical protein